MASLPDDRLHDGSIALSDGRRFAWREGGDAHGTPLLAFHGLPGSRLKFDVASEHARGLGIRLDSVLAPSPAIADCVMAHLRSFGRC